MSSSQVLDLAREILESRPGQRRLGLRCSGPWAGPEILEVPWKENGQDRLESARVRVCRSSLELRQGLIESEGSADLWIFLADLSPIELGHDLESRLARGRLHEGDRWRTVRRQFQARELDPRLSRQGWIADLLIAGAPPAGYRPVVGGLLSESTARRALLEIHLRLSEAVASPVALLQWISRPGPQERYGRAPLQIRQHFVEWLKPDVGPLVEVLGALLEAGAAEDAIALGLVAEVVAEAPVEGPFVRLVERHLDQREPSSVARQAWIEAAGEAVRVRDRAEGWNAVAPWLSRAEELLGELVKPAEEPAQLVIHSDWLPRAFDERLAQACRALDRWLGRRAPQALEQAECLAAHLQRHQLARHRDLSRVTTLEQALALARWLAAPATRVSSLTAAILGYADDGGWVDLARQSVGRGDPASEVQQVYERLLGEVSGRREDQNRRFAELLAAAGGEAPEHARLAAVEDVLERWAAPLASTRPLLVVVLDGLGQVVWRQMVASVSRTGWRELVPRTGLPPARAQALTVLPTTTRTSRVSLLCGYLAEGDSARERRGFAAHPALAAIGKSPPRLFVPGELKNAGGGLEAKVRSEIFGKQPVVGVVLPDVDALFESGSDLRSAFGVSSVGPLDALLRLAAEAGRVVLITGDHGQVPGAATELERSSSSPHGKATGSRHDAGASVPAEGEIQLQGRRVLVGPFDDQGRPRGPGEILVAWSERLRYRKGGRAGYHGGASPREMVVPVAVLARQGVEIEGWEVLERELSPTWWEAAGPLQPKPVRHKPVRTESSRPSSEPSPDSGPTQLSLVAPPSLVASPSLVAADESSPSWLANLLDSEVYAQQVAVAGRRPLAREKMRDLLTALDGARGVLTLPALARCLGTTRLPGLLTQASRVLNVDGYGVLTVDMAAETVRFDRALLEKQFDLKETR